MLTTDFVSRLDLSDCVEISRLGQLDDAPLGIHRLDARVLKVEPHHRVAIRLGRDEQREVADLVSHVVQNVAVGLRCAIVGA
jgi:hypothetical protein